MPDEVLFHVLLATGGLLFALGACGLASRRNLLVMTLCGAMALHGGIVVAIAFGLRMPEFESEAVALLGLLVLAVQLTTGLACVAVSWIRQAGIDPATWNALGDETPRSEPS